MCRGTRVGAVKQNAVDFRMLGGCSNPAITFLSDKQRSKAKKTLTAAHRAPHTHECVLHQCFASSPRSQIGTKANSKEIQVLGKQGLRFGSLRFVSPSVGLAYDGFLSPDTRFAIPDTHNITVVYSPAIGHLSVEPNSFRLTRPGGQNVELEGAPWAKECPVRCSEQF